MHILLDWIHGIASVSVCSDEPSSALENSGFGDARTILKLIGQEDLMPGLKGINADNNEIRDDIDRLIAKNYSATPEFRKTSEKKAHNMQ